MYNVRKTVVVVVTVDFAGFLVVVLSSSDSFDNGFIFSVCICWYWFSYDIIYFFKVFNCHFKQFLSLDILRAFCTFCYDMSLLDSFV